MPVPNQFANVTTSIPLSQLDANFNTPITLGNTAIQLGNTVTTLNNMTLANVTISSGSINVTSGNITVTNATVTTANVATANVTTSQILNYGTANGVAYLNASKSLTTGSSITFDGTNLSLATGKVTTSATGTNAGYQWGGTTVTSRLYDDGGGNIYLDIGAGASNATVPLVIRTKGGSVTWSNGTSSTMTLDANGTFRVKGAGTAGSTDALQISGSAPASAMSLDANGFQLLNSVAEIRASWGTDISGTLWGFLKLASASNNFAGRIDLWMRAQDAITPNSAVYSIAGYSNAGRTETYFNVLKSERIANSVLIVTDASGNLYLAVSKGNANGGAGWNSRITTDAITGLDGKTVTFAANLTGYTTRQTL